MSADEMFKELGYLKKDLKDKWDRIWGIEYINIKQWISIKIDYKDAEVCIGTLGDSIEYHDDAEPVYIKIEELKAINKKCEELGWL